MYFIPQKQKEKKMETVNIREINNELHTNSGNVLKRLIEVSTAREQNEIKLKKMKTDYEVLTESRQRLLYVFAASRLGDFNNIISFSRSIESLKWDAKWQSYKVYEYDTKLGAFYALLKELPVQQLEELLKYDY